jgi:uncharacterized delta-60 repeat protein
MKKIYFLILVLFYNIILTAQNPNEIDFKFNYNNDVLQNKNGVYTNHIGSITIQPDGKIILAGSLAYSWEGAQKGIVRLNTDGTFDTSFNVGTGFLYGANIFALALQPDGKIIVGGTFSYYNGNQLKNLVRLNVDGSVDLSFDKSLGFISTVYAITVQPDGKIIVGGQGFLTRLNSDGSIDSTFNTGVGFSGDWDRTITYVAEILVQDDSKIIVAGNFTTYNGVQANCVIRLNPNGTIDNTFNVGLGAAGSISSIAKDINGKIILGGRFTMFNGISQNKIIRINADGSKDPSFNIGVGFNGFGDTISDIAVKPNGKIVVVGSLTRYDNYYRSLNMVIVNNNGSRDQSFDSGFKGDEIISTVVLQPDGKIIIGGTNIVDNYDFLRLLGNDFYTFKGENKLSIDNNTCEIADLLYIDFLKFSVSNKTVNTTYISDRYGKHLLFLKNGINLINPILENPDYFNITPSSISLSFPTTSNPHIENFCITPNGVRNDLEITLIPLTSARPGFDAKYKIVYKNKGNTTQSGAVNLTFNDAVLDFVVANPVTTSQTLNNLSWSFTNLQPFETREITFTMNVNSPMEIPAVNIADVLNFTTSFTSVATDETPADNAFTLNQIVVGSYDPNDKTCLEGTEITPDLIGQYVHYLIRFENTGTYPAENIVVKDMIDLSKFDISTLVPTSSSHSFITNITAGNKVEFIFENINLPFDDANNDGYIAFKIKTKPTLVVNDSFTNEANIYFDYNFPILTNKATSTFKTLGTPDFNFAKYFTLYPNPTKADLNITAKEAINVKSISVYNTLGQLVLVVANADKVSKIDVSGLTSGNYFVKINSDKGNSNARFVKE